jgi:hypothetical protein
MTTTGAPVEDAARRGRKRTAMLWLLAILVVCVVAAIAAGPIMSRVEQPKYDVVQQDGAIEVRDYGAMIVAEAEVEGERKLAIEQGFRLIAAYIFGANTPNTKIAMTAPVQQQASSKIAMTAPVTQQAGASDRWTVRFVMPSDWTLDKLPAPKDPRVTLHPQAARRMLAIGFSGLASDEVIKAKTLELRDYAARHSIATTGEPLLAFYNPPWTLPIFRRNEIMLDISPPT